MHINAAINLGAGTRIEQNNTYTLADFQNAVGTLGIVLQYKI